MTKITKYYADPALVKRSFFDQPQEEKKRIRCEIVKRINDLNKFLKSHDLEVRDVNIIKSTKARYRFSVHIDNITYAEEKQHNEKLINQALQIKDMHNISDKAYAGIQQLKLDIPSLYEVRQYRLRLNTYFEVKTNSNGAYVDPQIKITKVLGYLIDNKIICSEKDILTIKLSGDGVKIGRKLKLLNVTFTCIDEGSKAKTAAGNYTLGIFKISDENYSQLELCTKEVFASLKDFTVFNHNGRAYKIKYYLGGDMKFLATVMGINSANAKYPCILCTIKQEDFHLSEEELQTPARLRSIEQSNLVVEANSKNINYQLGYIRKPLISFIDFNDCIIDLLHLLLRVTDRLFDLFFQTLDSFEQNKKEQSLMRLFMDKLVSKCAINSPYYVADGKVKLKSLNGNERLRILEADGLFDSFQFIPNIDKVSRLWKELARIYNLVKNNQLTQEEVRKETRSWLNLFVSLYFVSYITPYIHCFVSHLHLLVERVGDVNLFNTQGLERLNSLTSKQYFRSNNKWTNSYLIQLINIRNRNEICSHVGLIN